MMKSLAGLSAVLLVVVVTMGLSSTPSGAQVPDDIGGDVPCEVFGAGPCAACTSKCWAPSGTDQCGQCCGAKKKKCEACCLAFTNAKKHAKCLGFCG